MSRLIDLRQTLLTTYANYGGGGSDFTGPMGPTGPTGATGPAGTTQTRKYARMYTYPVDGAAISNQAQLSVPLYTDGVAPLITLTQSNMNATGDREVLMVNSSGTYDISMFITTGIFEGNPITFSIAINEGTPIAESSFITYNATGATSDTMMIPLKAYNVAISSGSFINGNFATDNDRTDPLTFYGLEIEIRQVA